MSSTLCILINIWSEKCRISIPLLGAQLQEVVQLDGEEQYTLLWCSTDKVFLSDIPGNEKKRISFTGTFPSFTPVSADLDNDSRPEIIAGNAVFAFEKDNNQLVKKMDIRGKGMGFKGHPVVIWDVDSDGNKELIVAGKGPQVRVYSHTNQLKWEKALPCLPSDGGLTSWTVGHFTDSKRYDIFVQAHPGDPHIGTAHVLSGLNGNVIWSRSRSTRSRGFGPILSCTVVHDLDGDGLDDILLLDSEAITTVCGKTGEDIQPQQKLSDLFQWTWMGYGNPVLVTADNSPAIFLCGVWGFNGALAIQKHGQWEAVWGDCYTNDTPVVSPPKLRPQGIAKSGKKLYLGGLCHDYFFRCFEGATGKQQWEMDFDGKDIGGVVTGDLDGDGQDEFLFGCNDGFLYAVKVNGSVLFKLDMASPVGIPIIADIDNDGKAEIIVTTTAGELFLIE